jgi:hypothetical protein
MREIEPIPASLSWNVSNMPRRNEHRQIATLMRSLTRDPSWLAVHSVDGIE